MPSSDDDLRYPVGKFSYDPADAAAHRTEWIDLIARFPATFRTTYESIAPAQRHRSYRPGGWNADQLVHHVADSHGNALFRMKLALTEDTPTIKPYDQAKWAELADVRTVPADVSLTLLDALHRRWDALLRALKPADFARDVFHPEMKAKMSIDQLLALYSWHGRHHTAHLKTIGTNPA